LFLRINHLETWRTVIERLWLGMPASYHARHRNCRHRHHAKSAKSLLRPRLSKALRNHGRTLTKCPMVTMSKPQQKLGNKQAYAQCCCLGSLRLFRVASPKLVYARNKIQPPRGCNMEEVGAASSELMRPLSAKLVCRFQNHLALQIRLPTQTRLRAFR